jgi:hypothetical protein
MQPVRQVLGQRRPNGAQLGTRRLKERALGEHMRMGKLTQLGRAGSIVALCLFGQGLVGVRSGAATAQADEAAGAPIQWIRATEAEVTGIPGGETIAILTRATPVEAIGVSQNWCLVNIGGWVEDTSIASGDPLSAGDERRLARDTRLFDAPMAWYWGGELEDLGAEVATVKSGAMVTCLDRALSTTHVFLRGWVLQASLTGIPESVGLPESCTSITLTASGDSTHVQGIMKWEHPQCYVRSYRLVLYGASGARVFVAPFTLEVQDGDAAVRDGVSFELRVPLPRHSIATYRVATPGSGIIALFR